MDFLDPKAKRRHSIRLFIGYGLVATLIATATMIMVYQAYGFNFNRKTGEVIQNGLVFVDSAPDQARISFNGQVHRDATNTRTALPAGKYDLKIQKDGYRPWQRGFELDGGTVQRFTYPLLIPEKLDRNELHFFDNAPQFATESPDRRWALVGRDTTITNYIQYDFNTLTDNKPAEQPLSFPSELFNNAAGAHSLEVVEWSTDNKHVLIKHTFTGGTEFIVLSREKPETSININKSLSQNPNKVTLNDKKFDEWYFYFEQGGVLQTASVKEPLPVTVTDKVVAYKSHGNDTLLYAQSLASGQVRVSLQQQGKDTYTVRDLQPGAVQLDIARYDGQWYVVVGSDSEHRTYIYKNPQGALARRDGMKPTPIATLKSIGPLTQVGFSQNTRFVLSQSGQHFETYDAEAEKTFRYDITESLDADTKVGWMDGHRLLARAAKKILMFDFDGSNQQTLLSSQPGLPILFDRDYTAFYSLDQKIADPSKYAFSTTPLRLPADK